MVMILIYQNCNLYTSIYIMGIEYCITYHQPCFYDVLIIYIKITIVFVLVHVLCKKKLNQVDSLLFCNTLRALIKSQLLLWYISTWWWCFFVLSQALPVFSAGLDIMELYQSKEDRLRTFWHNVQELVLNVYSSPKAVITAIEVRWLHGSTVFLA